MKVLTFLILTKIAYGRACKTKLKTLQLQTSHILIHIFGKTSPLKSPCWKSMERPYGLEVAVEVEGCRKGWEVNPRASIILETIKAVSTISFQSNCPPKLERGHHGRLFHQSTEAFKLNLHWNHPTPQLDYYFPLFPHWKGSLIHMFLIHLYPTHHNGILRELLERQKNSIPSFIFLFCLLNPHFPHCVDMDSSFGQL